ncbi:MAG: hypothetical protein ABJF01_07950 [bacterium]
MSDIAAFPSSDDIELHHDVKRRSSVAMSWALEEFFAAVEDEFGVPVGEAGQGFLETPGAVIDFVVDNTSPSDGMTADEHRDHVAGVVGEIMARTLGVTRYGEDSRFVQDLHVR